MHTPLRTQVSEYDCVPTTILNGLSYLFNRNEIPPAVVQRVYLYCLDCISPRAEMGHGTTGYAVQLLTSWLQKFRRKGFALSAIYLERDAVNLGPNNKIAQTLNKGGVAALSVCYSAKERHYVLATWADSEWIHCFDPYPKKLQANKRGYYEFYTSADSPYSNLRIRRSGLDARDTSHRYQFGASVEREAVLMLREEV